MRLVRLLTVTIAGVLFLAGSAGATVWRVPGRFATIQAAVDNSLVVAGDTIQVAPGKHAGATVTKAITIRGEGRATIVDGPVVGPLGKAGFLFEGSGAGSGATITDLYFRGVAFPVFSRGANEVSVTQNTMWNPIQGVTNWAYGSWGNAWEILGNTILGLTTSCGGGIGILVGDFAGGTVSDNLIAQNRIRGLVHVPQTDCGGYNAPGILLLADHRYPGDLGATIQGTRVSSNRVRLSDIPPRRVTVSAIEMSDTRNNPALLDIRDNDVIYNDLRDQDVPISLTPDELATVNRIEHNLTGPGGGWPDRALSFARAGRAGAAPVR